MLKRFLSQFSLRNINPENPNSPLSYPSEWLVRLFGGGSSDAGVTVTPKTALTVASFFQGVNLISGDVAKLPIHLYRNRRDGGRERDQIHSSSYLLRRKANSEMTAGQFKRLMVAHALCYGNGYAAIFRDAMRPVELIPLLPDQTYPERVNGILRYVTTIGGQRRFLAAEDVFHLHGLGFDGIRGYSVVTLARHSLGLAIAAERFGSKFFANGARSSGVLLYPGRLKGPAAEQLAKSFDDKHQGVDKSHKTILLEEGAKYQPLTIPPEEAQFLQTRQFQGREVASWLNLPPHKIGDPARTSYSSLEQENQSYLESCLDHWLSAFEEEAWDKLLTEQEKEMDSHYFEFNRAALLRTDLQTRYAAYAIGRQWGWLSANDVRRSENMDGIGEQGDVYMIPANMYPADKIEELTAVDAPLALPAPQGDDEEGQDGTEADERQAALEAAHRAVLLDAVGRMVRREANAIRQIAKKPSSFLDKLDEFVAEQEKLFAEAVTPALNAVRAWKGEDNCTSMMNPVALAIRHMAAIKDEMLDAAGSATPATLAELVDQRVSAWRTEDLINMILTEDKE